MSIQIFQNNKFIQVFVINTQSCALINLFLEIFCAVVCNTHNEDLHQYRFYLNGSCENGQIYFRTYMIRLEF